MVALGIAVTTQENLVIFTLSRVSVELTKFVQVATAMVVGCLDNRV